MTKIATFSVRRSRVKLRSSKEDEDCFGEGIDEFEATGDFGRSFNRFKDKMATGDSSLVFPYKQFRFGEQRSFSVINKRTVPCCRFA